MEFTSARSIEAATEVLGKFGTDTCILAGGTDVMVQLERGEIVARKLLHIEKIAALRRIESNSVIEIGALCSHRALAIATELNHIHALQQAAAGVGGWQTQQVGTLGGNICNASPAADTIPPLLVHDARVALVSYPDQERTLPLSAFVVGRRHIDRAPNELLSHVLIEPAPARTFDTYVKVGRRSAMEIAIVGLAIRLTLLDDYTTISDMRIAVCAVGPVPRRLPDVEPLFIGQRPNDELFIAASAEMSKHIAPIDDVRGSAAYRRRVLAGVLKHAVGSCLQKAGGGS